MSACHRLFAKENENLSLKDMEYEKTVAAVHFPICPPVNKLLHIPIGTNLTAIVGFCALHRFSSPAIAYYAVGYSYVNPARGKYIYNHE
jgi:hypothetical protein